MSSRRPTPGLLLAGLLVLPVGLAAQGVERFELTGDRVAVFNLAGSAAVEAGSGSAVVVEVRRQGRDAGRLEIQQGPIRDAQTLRVVYPDSRIRFPSDEWRGRTTLRVREDGTFGGWSERGDDSRRVTISTDGEGMEAAADLRILVPRGRRVSVYLAVGPISASNVDGDLRLDGGSGAVTTQGTSGTLAVDVGSGSVRVTGHTGDGSVDTGSGSVEITGMRGDDLNVDTGSGRVGLSDIVVRSLLVDTGSGDVGGSGVHADVVSLDTGSGSVEFGLLRAPREITVDTGSGNVMFTMPAGLNADVVLETGSGAIEMDFAMEVRRWERDEVRGVVGSGGGSIRIETGSGDITIRKQ
jgi:DUF4097 and DUF4098 domain-containing protein YvlB